MEITNVQELATPMITPENAKMAEDVSKKPEEMIESSPADELIGQNIDILT